MWQKYNMAKKKVRRIASSKGDWAGFTPFQLIVIFSVFIIFAIFYLL